MIDQTLENRTEQEAIKIVPTVIDDFESKLYGQKFFSFEKNGRTYYIKPENYEKFKKQAVAMKKLSGLLIRDFSDYLYADDRTDAKYVLDSEDDKLVAEAHLDNPRTTPGRLLLSIKRARTLKREGIPPIYNRGYEGSKLRTDEKGFTYFAFPTLDSIINFFSRSHVKRKDKRVAKRNDLEEIIFFSDFALRDPFAEKVKKEIGMRIGQWYEKDFSSEESKEYVLENVRRGFDYLQKELSKQSKSSSFKLREYNPAMDSKAIINTPFWYARFSEPAIPLVINSYWNGFIKDFLESKDLSSENHAQGYEGAKRAMDIFPELTPDFRNIDGNKASYLFNQARENSDYSILKEEVMQHLGEEQKEVLRQDIRRKLEKLSPERLAVKHYKSLLEDLDMPNKEYFRSLVEPVSVEVHLARVQGLSDKEVIKYFNEGERERFSLVNYPKVGEYLAQRVYDMIGEITDCKKGSFGYKARELGFSETGIVRAKGIYNGSVPVKEKRKQKEEQRGSRSYYPR
ncbi:MAG TPA: hypothetical protein VJ438_00865 [Candidatus Nanoarchaeia archaeon]|nr:hypothetical protein [Candidatus Nanoarchaeia archaeon]